jgi:hypothetical protein
MMLTVADLFFPSTVDFPLFRSGVWCHRLRVLIRH